MIKNFYLKIKKFFSRRSAIDKNKWEPNPRHSWALVVTFFFVGLLISLGSFAWLYANLIGFSEDKSLPANLTSSVERRNLNTALTEFKNKAERFNELETKPVIVDPSL